MVRSRAGLGSPGQSNRATVPKKGIASNRLNQGKAINPGIVILARLPQATSSRR